MIPLIVLWFGLNEILHLTINQPPIITDTLTAGIAETMFLGVGLLRIANLISFDPFYVILSYFLYDICEYIRHPEHVNRYVFIIHHIVSIFTIMIFKLTSDEANYYMLVMVFLLEISSPMLNFGDVIRFHGHHHLHKKILKSIIILFPITRLILPNLIMYYVITHHIYEGLSVYIGLTFVNLLDLIAYPMFIRDYRKCKV